MDVKEEEFFKYAVYDTVRSVPEGKVTTYGTIARAVGCPGMARLVGKVMSECGDADVPAHRVVNAGGRLSAEHLFGSGGKMKKRLEEEGITIGNGRIKGWKNVYWNPMEEIG